MTLADKLKKIVIIGSVLGALALPLNAETQTRRTSYNIEGPRLPFGLGFPGATITYSEFSTWERVEYQENGSGEISYILLHELNYYIDGRSMVVDSRSETVFGLHDEIIESVREGNLEEIIRTIRISENESFDVRIVFGEEETISIGGQDYECITAIVKAKNSGERLADDLGLDKVEVYISDTGIVGGKLRIRRTIFKIPVTLNCNLDPENSTVINTE